MISHRRTVQYSTEFIHFDVYHLVKADVGWKNPTVILSFFMFFLNLIVRPVKNDKLITIF